MLHNFKSFRKGSVEFVRGVNGITGPNGSGKSTICDAILFALGENSLSRLRVNKVSKLINESSNKPIASVKIELDGDRKVEVKRIIRADGKTKFYLNGKRVTRKALVDFLKAFSAEPSSTNTIAQEEVTRLINMSPKERRALIDEISGIEEFNQKKEEAKKELEKVEQKLSEANILLNERLGYLKELEKERAQALLYKELQEKIRKINFAIVSFSLEENKKNLDSLIKKELELQQKKKEIEEKIKEKNSELEKIRGSLKEKIQKINELNLQKQSFIEKKQELEKSMELTKYKLAKEEESLKKLENEKEEQEKKLEELMKREIELKKEFEKINEEIKNIYGNEKVIEEEELERRRARIAEERAKSVAILNQVEEEEKSNIEEIEKEIKEIEKEIEEKVKEIKDFEKNLEEIEKQKNEIGMKIIEEEAKGRGKVYDFVSKKEGVYGTVAEIINFNKDYEKAINACAASRMNYFVVENADVANRIIKELNEKKIGRAGFIPLKELKETRKEKGSIAELISYDKKFEKVINYLFGSTFLANFEEIKENPGKRYVTIDGTIVEESFILTGGYIETVNFGELKKKQKELEKQENEIREILAQKRKELSSIELRKIELKTKAEYERRRIEEIRRKNNELRKAKEEARKRLQELQKLEEELNSSKPVSKQIIEKRIIVSKLEPEIRNVCERKEEALKRIKQIEEEISKIKKQKQEDEEELKKIEEELKNIKPPQEFEQIYKEYQELQEKENSIAKELGAIQKEIDFAKDEEQRIAIRKAEIETRLKDLLAEIKNYKEEDKGIEIKTEEERQKLEKELEEAKKKIEELKNVNLLAIQAYEEKSKELKEIEEKVERIKQEKEAILKMIKEIDEKKNRVFKENFEKVNSNFKKLYYYAFNEEAELYLDKPREPFSSGLFIKVKKAKRDEESFSGGEKTILFLLLLFALHFTKNLSFYLLDEVDAPLDKENTKKIFSLIKKISQESGTQFIIVTHNDLSIRQMDAVIGVTKTSEGSQVYGIDLQQLQRVEEKK
jgi:chromosome segregation protein